MAGWEITHGKARGAYMVAGESRLYVRQVLGPDGMPTGRWKLFVDGVLEASAEGEDVARAAAELAVRGVVEAGDAGVAAAAGQSGRAA